MKFRVTLIESEEGFAVSCLALRGCHSQGSTKDEALENIKIAIKEWLEVDEQLASIKITEEEVTV